MNEKDSVHYEEIIARLHEIVKNLPEANFFTIAKLIRHLKRYENFFTIAKKIQHLKRYELYIAQKRNATVEKCNFSIFGYFKCNILWSYHGQLWSIIEVQREPLSEVGYLSPTEHPLGFEPATYPFDHNALNHWASLSWLTKILIREFSSIPHASIKLVLSDHCTKNYVKFTEEYLNGKLHFLCSDLDLILPLFQACGENVNLKVPPPKVF